LFQDDLNQATAAGASTATTVWVARHVYTPQRDIETELDV